MKSLKQLNNIVGWTVFAIAAIVYILTAEPTGSLWDCGEFIAGAYKLQVVHPPGAPLFILVGRLFTYVAEIFSSNPADIAYAVNIMSGLCTAFAALFIFWSTTILAKLTLVGRGNETTDAQNVAILAAGTVAGLATTFSTSIWFSAVEGEVYAMSTFFTTLVLWATLKWYGLPDTKNTDRWLIFAAYMAGLSMGVHLLSLLVFPTMALLFYFKKFKKTNFRGIVLASLAGVGVLILVQNIIILRLPKIGAAFELAFVNSIGLPFGSGFLFFVALFVGAIIYGIYYSVKNKKPILQRAMVALAMVVVGFSTYGTVVIRANANTPINMNNPSDVFTLVSYLNREQYGDRPLLRGPHFAAQPIGTDTEDRYGPVGDRYEVVDRKVSYKYRATDNMFLPRVGHYDKKDQHGVWMDAFGYGQNGSPDMAYNMRFMFKYQLGWMYWRYFFWNFVGRQNGDQGFHPWDSRNGHWQSGIKAVDNVVTYNQNALPDTIKNHKARNHYYFLPLIFGLFGFFYFFRNNPNDATAILALFVISGIGIIIQSNQPPNEPRERDYVLVGSILSYCIWMGMGVLAFMDLFMKRFQQKSMPAAVAAAALVIIAPLIMGFQNWDDHTRGDHTGARDYAVNFLESCEENAIIFTHGDNDTYPLWYAQEVEGIRTDVRVINLSLLAVDWYIDQLRRKINKSPKIEMSIPSSQYQGFKRNQLLYTNTDILPPYSNIGDVVKYMAEDHPVQVSMQTTIESALPVKQISIPVDKAKVLANGTVAPSDTGRIVNAIRFSLPKSKNSIIKDELAIMDIIASNKWERPIYFAVTCRPDKLMGLKDYMQLEGMAMRLIPVKTKSDRQLGMMGNGRIDTERMYNNIMTKYKWGNFDKKDLFVNRSYMPSVMSMRLGFYRLSKTYIDRGQKDRAIEVLDKYFEAFPHMNFPYDFNTMILIAEYYRAGAPEKAEPHIRIAANEATQYLTFFASLDLEDRQDFNFEEQRTQNMVQQINSLIQQNSDAFKGEISAMIAPYIAQPTER